MLDRHMEVAIDPLAFSAFICFGSDFIGVHSGGSSSKATAPTCGLRAPAAATARIRQTTRTAAGI